ncbi:MAG: glutamine amidotransferase-related protein [Promethearchaeota archaeon]
MDKSLKIVLINNYGFMVGNARIKRFREIFESALIKVDLSVDHYLHFSDDLVKDCDGVILSGSNLNVSDFYYNSTLRESFEPLLSFLKENSSVPVLGICFGLHLIAYAYGAMICRMPANIKTDNIILIEVDGSDDLITKQKIPVNVNHQDFVCPNDINLLKNFKIKAVYNFHEYRIIHYIQHCEKPIYAMQFHPETHEATYDYESIAKYDKNLINENTIQEMTSIGEEILYNFLWLCSYKKQGSKQES